MLRPLALYSGHLPSDQTVDPRKYSRLTPSGASAFYSIFYGQSTISFDL